jgi:hypothetical protein
MFRAKQEVDSIGAGTERRRELCPNIGRGVRREKGEGRKEKSGVRSWEFTADAETRGKDTCGVRVGKYIDSVAAAGALGLIAGRVSG